MRVRERLERRLEIKAVERRQRRQPETLELALPDRSAGQRVERSVVARLSSPEAPAFYVENSLITSLFGLLCWRRCLRRFLGFLPSLPGGAGRSANRGVSRTTRGAVRFRA